MDLGFGVKVLRYRISGVGFRVRVGFPWKPWKQDTPHGEGKAAATLAKILQFHKLRAPLHFESQGTQDSLLQGPDSKSSMDRRRSKPCGSLQAHVVKTASSKKNGLGFRGLD